jgi:hypothetical protein
MRRKERREREKEREKGKGERERVLPNCKNEPVTLTEEFLTKISIYFMYKKN